MPYNPFFMGNLGALVAATIFSLYLNNIIAANFFRHLSLRSEKLEAQFYAGAVIVFMAVPALVAVAFSGISASRYQTLFLDELVETIHHLPPWLYFIIIIPYSLTLAVLWKARDRGYRQFCRVKNTDTRPV
jgi:predicted membrane-bound spermidine synthase